ncbi:DUF4185 domain-containing protein [Pyxidicoccus fallax]|uniref:DUF4185 domain-containing protein n=1 Tax=Pyxidicoccus fallax TaxID=394095 RepID=A0A848LEL5_9BACT|nr:DUF4185 domain-containing protein [Pyxidicoccus fallax]NMO16682.1 DUF4185 domain-containing protein [Pyxidicoccus fallax]NPC79247.1 DUF4185 domain-containing protein [Pyxidicoccus fallax]
MRYTRTWKRTLRLHVMPALALLMAGSAGAVTPTGVTKVSRVTGATPAGEVLPNPNQTHSNYEVYGTDLGIVWDKGGGEVFVLFGDTFGAGWCGNGGCGGGWRSNVLARSSDTALANGLSFSTMIQDYARHAKEILPSRKIDNDEMTVIPTAGVTVGSRHYIHYMSVRHWGEAGTWQTNYAGIAYSDDNGQNWVKHPTARWQNNASWTNNFQMAAFVKNGGFVYMYATPNGRRGNVHLARVPEGSLLDINAYRYWDGNGWSTSQAAARPVAIGIAGELSVSYNAALGRFLMTYLNEHRQAIVMRDAATPTGPWSGEKVLASGSAFPGLYNAFIHPWGNTATELYFVMSQWTPYNTFLMRATLTGDTEGDNLLSEPSFETQAATPVMAPWYVQGQAGIDRNLFSARTGQDNGFVRNNSGWNALKQSVVVQPYTDYTLRGWVRTSSNNTAGYFGARGVNNGPVLSERAFGSLPGYTEQVVSFNSGANSVVEVYGGLWANGDTWLQLDDVSLTRVGNLVAQPGFEQQPSTSATSPWYADGNAGIDRGLGFARTGANNAWARNTQGWNAIKQEVAVTPNTRYTLTGWVKTAGAHTDGYFGARVLRGGPILNEVPFTQPLGSYTRLSVTFDSGSNHSVELFAGMWAHGTDTWIQVDDVSLTRE